MADQRPDPNLVFRAVRDLEFQMSRPEFARAVVAVGREMNEPVGCSTRLIAAWEDGTVACPSPPYRRILTRMTGRSMAELGFRVTPARGPAPVAVSTGTYGRAEENDSTKGSP